MLWKNCLCWKQESIRACWNLEPLWMGNFQMLFLLFPLSGDANLGTEHDLNISFLAGLICWVRGNYMHLKTNRHDRNQLIPTKITHFQGNFLDSHLDERHPLPWRQLHSTFLRWQVIGRASRIGSCHQRKLQLDRYKSWYKSLHHVQTWKSKTNKKQNIKFHTQGLIWDDPS